MKKIILYILMTAYSITAQAEGAHFNGHVIINGDPLLDETEIINVFATFNNRWNTNTQNGDITYVEISQEIKSKADSTSGNTVITNVSTGPLIIKAYKNEFVQVSCEVMPLHPRLYDQALNILSSATDGSVIHLEMRRKFTGITSPLEEPQISDEWECRKITFIQDSRYQR